MAIVVSGGDVTALQRTWSPQWPAAASLRLFDDRFADYAAIYRTQPAVRKCVGFLARNIAELGLHVFRRVSDTDRTRLNGHPLAVLLARPNKWTTRYRLMDALVNDLGIYDEAFWLKWRDGSTPALIRIPPTKVAVQGSWLEPTGFTIYGATGKIDLDRSQMVFFRGYNPDSELTLRGLSPLETLRRVLAEDDAMGDYRERLWRSGARFEGVLTRPVDAPRMSPEAKDRFWARWNASHTGSTATGSTALLEEGMAYAQTSFSAKDSQYQESRRLNDEEVAAAYHIPLPMVGHLENATFSNISEQHKNLYQDTLGPRLEELVEEIELQLLPDFGANSADVYCEFNLDQKLRGSFEEQAAALQASVGGPWVTRNEARARTNLPSVDGGDELITPLNVVTGGQASPQDSVPPSRALALVDSLSKEMAQ